MTDQEKMIFKNKLKQLCQSLIAQRIDAVKLNINRAQEAANNEEKSSAGDKYETSRAMNQLERDMHSRQLAEIVKELANLHGVDVSRIYTRGEPGAYVQCSGISFFIAAGLGKQRVENITIYFLSPNAPLAKMLQNKKAGDHFIFNQTQTTILEIY
jgi:hypothetical protein